MSEPINMTNEQMQAIANRLSRLPDPSNPLHIMRRLNRAGLEATPERVQAVAAFLMETDHPEVMPPAAKPKASKAPTKKKAPKGEEG